MFAFCLALQFALAIAAVLVVGRSPGRRAAGALFVLASAVLPWFSPAQPFERVVLATLTVLAVFKTAQIARAVGPWPARQRVWHLFVLFDVRQARRGEPAIERRSLAHMLVATAVGGAALFALVRSPHAILRFFCGLILLYTILELISAATQFGHRLAGIEVPPLQRAPILSRSAGEFWSIRWNRCVSEWLAQFAFRPFARRRQPELGLVVAFLVSAALHAWLAGVAVGTRAAVMIAAYFILQAIVVIAEPRLGVRKWPSPLAHGWTVFVLVGPAYLIIDPFLRVVGL